MSDDEYIPAGLGPIAEHARKARRLIQAEQLLGALVYRSEKDLVVTERDLNMAEGGMVEIECIEGPEGRNYTLRKLGKGEKR